jgi:hypothetical protein
MLTQRDVCKGMVKIPRLARGNRCLAHASWGRGCARAKSSVPNQKGSRRRPLRRSGCASTRDRWVIHLKRTRDCLTPRPTVTLRAKFRPRACASYLLKLHERKTLRGSRRGPSRRCAGGAFTCIPAASPRGRRRDRSAARDRGGYLGGDPGIAE